MSVDHSSHFSEDNFLSKVRKICIKAGLKAIYTALLLYYAMQEPSVPVMAKAKIVAALGYFIFPFDAIPDLMPMGFVDDYGVLSVALMAVAMHINNDVKAKAKTKLKDLFGEVVDMSEIIDIDKDIDPDGTA